MKFFVFVSFFLLANYALTGHNIDQPFTWLLICFWWALALSPSNSKVEETCLEVIRKESKR